MNYSDYRFTLDVQIHQAQVSVPVTLNDTARRLYIGFTDGRKPYTIPDGCRAVFAALKPDKTSILNDCIIENNKTVVYEFSKNTTNAEGTVNCEIRLYDKAGRELTSPQFIIVVDKKVVRDEEISLSESESTTIDSIISSEFERVAAEEKRKELAQFLATSGGVIVSEDEPQEELGNVWLNSSNTESDVFLLDSTDIAQELSDDENKIPSVALLKKVIEDAESDVEVLKEKLRTPVNAWEDETDVGKNFVCLGYGEEYTAICEKAEFPEAEFSLEIEVGFEAGFEGDYGDEIPFKTFVREPVGNSKSFTFKILGLENSVFYYELNRELKTVDFSEEHINSTGEINLMNWQGELYTLAGSAEITDLRKNCTAIQKSLNNVHTIASGASKSVSELKTDVEKYRRFVIPMPCEQDGDWKSVYFNAPGECLVTGVECAPNRYIFMKVRCLKEDGSITWYTIAFGDYDAFTFKYIGEQDGLVSYEFNGLSKTKQIDTTYTFYDICLSIPNGEFYAPADPNYILTSMPRAEDWVL